VRLLVDTNRYADLVADTFAAKDLLESASEIWLSVITVGELLAGFAKGNRYQRNVERLSELLSLQGVGVLTIDRETAEGYAKIWLALSKLGTQIPTNDIWIAAQALQHGLIVASRDQHFQQVAGVKVI
jgi:tRNA(fMet)-specific endonuclease VapC